MPVTFEMRARWAAEFDRLSAGQGAPSQPTPTPAEQEHDRCARERLLFPYDERPVVDPR